MPEYISAPLETDHVTIAEQALEDIAARIPGWEPAEGNLDVILTRAICYPIAEAEATASRVATDIFRWFGTYLAGVPSIEATQATGQTTWVLADADGHTIPAGTQVQFGPPDSPAGFFVVDDVVVPPGATTTAAGEVTIRAIEAGAQGSGFTGEGQLVDGLVFVESVTLEGATTGGIDAEDDDVYLGRLREELTLQSASPILPDEFATLARRVPGVARAVAINLYDPDHNRLTANQASLETNTAGWVAESNATLSRSTAQAWDGVASLLVTSSAAGEARAATSAGVLGVAVQAGGIYTAMAMVNPGGTPRPVRLDVSWFNSGGSTLAASTGSAVTAPASTWTQFAETVTAPSGAAYAAIRVAYTAAAASNTVYVDGVSFHAGESRVWKLGPSDGENTPRFVSVAAIDADGQPVGANVQADVLQLLEASREVNFEVRVITPVVTPVSVVFGARCYPGFTPSEVEVAVVESIGRYLNPASWGAPPTGDGTDWVLDNTVRYLEVAQAINETQGVWYITSLNVNGGAGDVTLPGRVALPTAGTIIGAVTL